MVRLLKSLVRVSMSAGVALNIEVTDAPEEPDDTALPQQETLEAEDCLVLDPPFSSPRGRVESRPSSTWVVLIKMLEA